MRAYVSVGSNLGSAAGGPYDTVGAAIRDLAALPGVAAVRASRVYRTQAVGPVPQPDFANAVVALDTTLTPERLLAELQAIERRYGRTRDVAQGPRTLDLDLLLAGAELRDTEALLLPHPRLAERRFVLVPLAELAPELVHPRLGRSMRELLDALGDRARVEPWPAAA